MLRIDAFKADPVSDAVPLGNCDYGEPVPGGQIGDRDAQAAIGVVAGLGEPLTENGAGFVEEAMCLAPDLDRCGRFGGAPPCAPARCPFP